MPFVHKDTNVWYKKSYETWCDICTLYTSFIEQKTICIALRSLSVICIYQRSRTHFQIDRQKRKEKKAVWRNVTITAMITVDYFIQMIRKWGLMKNVLIIIQPYERSLQIKEFLRTIHLTLVTYCYSLFIEYESLYIIVLYIPSFINAIGSLSCFLFHAPVDIPIPFRLILLALWRL